MGNAGQVRFSPVGRFSIYVDQKRLVWPRKQPEQSETEPHSRWGIVKIRLPINQKVERVPVADDSSSKRQGKQYLQTGFQKVFQLRHKTPERCDSLVLGVLELYNRQEICPVNLHLAGSAKNLQ